MINLIESELYKLKKSKTFKICMFLSFIISVTLIFISMSSNILSSNILIQTIFEQDQLDKLIDNYINQYPFVSAIVGTGWNPTEMNTTDPIAYTINSIGFAAPISIIFAIFISIFITSDFSNGNIKNIISKGYSRFSIYISKLIVVFISSILILYIFLFTSFIISFIANGFKITNLSNLVTMLYFLVYQSIVHISIASIFTMFSVIFDNTIISTLANLFILPMFTTAFQFISIIFKINVYSFWIPACSTVFNSLNTTKYDIFKGVIISSIYLIVSTSVGIYMFKNKDINR